MILQNPLFLSKSPLPYFAQSELVRIHQNNFGFVRKTRYIPVGQNSIMNSNEVAFSLSLKRKGIRTVALLDDRQESEVTGTLGKIQGLTVLDDIVLEIHCSHGTLRISLPKEQLKHFHTSGNE